MSSMFERYATQSIVTDPGDFAHMMEALPQDPVVLIDLISHLLIHFETDASELNEATIAKRIEEIDSRYIPVILQRLIEMNKAPLNVARAPGQRLLSTCRDTAVMLCSMLRAVGIPSRVRYGFARFFYHPTHPLHNHVVVEYWRDNKWNIADSRLSREFCRKHNITLDPADIPSGCFVSGGEAWKQVRAGEYAASAFSGLKGSDEFGFWTIRNLLVFDLASLCGFEPLLWDCWGVMLLQPPGVAPKAKIQLSFLDDISSLNPRDPQECDDLIRIFSAARGLFPDGEIMSYSPTGQTKRLTALPPATSEPV